MGNTVRLKLQKTRKCQQGQGDTNKEPDRWSKDQSALTDNNDVIQGLSSRAGRAKEAISKQREEPMGVSRTEMQRGNKMGYPRTLKDKC